MRKIELPIAGFRKELLKTIKENQVTIIVAETGAGKSTQVPQFLLQEGFEVVVTQPRRLPARTVAERVAYEWGSNIGGMVGYQTAFEQKKCATTRCLFVTDGLALVNELLGKRKPNTVLVIDEVHEWNVNIETLVAFIKTRLGEDKTLKVVLMSATVEAAKLSDYFGGAPIIDVPGRMHPIHDATPSGDMLADVVTLLKYPVNTLVFMPGKGEVDDFCEELRNTGVEAVILPLYSELTPEAQARCFESYRKPKCIVATNVAQTSITISDVRAVVDCGMEKRKEVVDGVEGLWLKPISFADSAQRRGRAGRCAGGIYIDYCPKDDETRLEFPKAEIMRSLLGHTVLRLAIVGLDAETLQFFHQPEPHAIHEAKESLKLLGCLDENGKVTDIGRQVEEFPLSVQYGRMLVEAKKRGVLSDMITIAAILEAGGITDRKGPWRDLCNTERESDLIAQLEIYKLCEKKDRKWIMDNGIHAKSLRRAREIRGRVSECFKKEELISSGDRKEMIRAITSGLVEHVFVQEGKGYRNGKGGNRKLSNTSVVSDSPALIVGLPFDIDGSGNGYAFALVSMVTSIGPKVLEDVAPHLVKKEEGLRPRYDYQKGHVVSSTLLHFRGRPLITWERSDPTHPQAGAILYRAGFRGVHITREKDAEVKAALPTLADPAKPADLTKLKGQTLGSFEDLGKKLG
ncbi:MAG: helicase-related protein [Patescibacteria group bacterium]